LKHEQRIDAWLPGDPHGVQDAVIPDSRVVGGVATGQGRRSYVLITAAYNEEEHIEKAILSVAAQTVLPARWIVVSDGSSDRTDDIVRQHADMLPFIELLSRPRSKGHDFASKVHALNEGANRLKNATFEFIGHLDADVSFGPTYYADLLEQFERDPKLGLAGGAICEWEGNRYAPRALNQVWSVPGSVQFFRRPCYESLEGFRPVPYGGEDWWAEVTSRMNGWRVRSFPILPVYHHRVPRDTAGRLRYWYRQGMMDFSLGTHPLFEVLRLARRIWVRPRILGALARLSGFARAAIRAEDRIVSREFMAFLRKEELGRLRWFGRET